MYFKAATNIKSLETSPFSLAPGHYHSSDGLSIANNWPIDDTNICEMNMIVFGNYIPGASKGYRVFLMSTNKGRMWFATEWWGEHTAMEGNRR